MDNEKVLALAAHLDIDADEVTETSWGFEADGNEYNVMTDEEADEAWEESLDSYLEECVYPDLDGNLSHYFDDEKWKRDARMDGRGHSLNHYDGCEYEEKINDTYYYIYQTN